MIGFRLLTREFLSNVGVGSGCTHVCLKSSCGICVHPNNYQCSKHFVAFHIMYVFIWLVITLHHFALCFFPPLAHDYFVSFCIYECVPLSCDNFVVLTTLFPPLVFLLPMGAVEL